MRGDTVRQNVLLAQHWMADYPAVGGLLALGGSVGTERELRRRADQALDLFGLRHLADERLGSLPYGTMRIAEIASAVASGPDLLLLDEASAGLTPEEAHALGERFGALRDELGLTLMVIEHHVPLIASTCDYCYCLESGALIAEGTPAQVTAEPRVIESFLGRGSLRARGGARHDAARGRRPVLGYGALQVLFGVSLTVDEGEVVALMGSNGAGKTTTLRTIVGMIPTDRRARSSLDERPGDRGASGAPGGAGRRDGARGPRHAARPDGRREPRPGCLRRSRDKQQVAESLDKAFTTFPILHERRSRRRGRCPAVSSRCSRSAGP